MLASMCTWKSPKLGRFEDLDKHDRHFVQYVLWQLALCLLQFERANWIMGKAVLNKETETGKEKLGLYR